MIEGLFWAASALILYAYAGYPVLVWVLATARGRQAPPGVTELPSVSMIIPAHNEREQISVKIRNIRELDYPRDRFEVICVSDGSTDGTVELMRSEAESATVVLELPQRCGKAAALNAGLDHARHEIVVFSDASIQLEGGALRRLVAPFADPTVGCVSGEDRIAGSGGEALYGRYELFIRRQESRLSSIVGASGCLYAQRRHLCGRFVANLAPDFLSVLRTVEHGYRAVSEPGATGSMFAVAQTGDEFQRKVRTLLRGVTTLAAHTRLLNPVRYPVFALELLSHKVLRWLVPVLAATVFGTSAWLATRSGLFQVAVVLQILFYVLALAGLSRLPIVSRTLPARAAAYLLVSNAAVVAALFKYGRGVRQELWSPTRRAQTIRS